MCSGNVDCLYRKEQHALTCGHVDENLLLDLPGCLVEILDLLWNRQLLHGAVCRNQVVLELRPQADLVQVLQQVSEQERGMQRATLTLA